MKQFLQRSADLFTAVLLSLSVVFAQSCSYMKVKPAERESYLSQEAEVPKDKWLMIYSGGEFYQVSQFQINQEGYFSGNYLKPLPAVEAELKDLMQQNETRVKDVKDIMYSLVVVEIAEEHIVADLNKIQFPVSQVSSISTIERDIGKHILVTLGLLSLTAAFVLLLIVLTKSSCPFVYTYDSQNNISFNGEIFGGAIFEPLERTDFMPLPHLQPMQDGKLRMVISNELKETQHINQIKLLAAKGEGDSEVLWTQEGIPLQVGKEWKVENATDDNGQSVTDFILLQDEERFMFTETKGELFEGLNLEFENVDRSEDLYLKLRLKNSLWLDQLWYRFTRHFGNYYTEWAQEQNEVPREEMMEWNRDQGINLEVLVKRNNEWELFHIVECIGPLADRTIAVPMPSPENGKLEVRLRSGLMFWDVNQASLIQAEKKEAFVVPINQATDQNGDNAMASLQYNDHNYLIQPNLGDSLKLSFDPPSEDQYSYCLQARGYYLHQRDFKNDPDWLKLLSFSSKHAFVEYSKEVMDHYKEHLKDAAL